MSIFKSTLKPFVIRQINARQDLLSSTQRTAEFSKYVSGKSPWIRMTSLVNYEGSSDLAKKYVLLGGTLYNYSPESATAFLRSGVGGRGASYGGDLSSGQYGIRPMPGITDASTRNMGAYGSLTEATVKFYAWDVRQLEDLSILFLRPGYRVVIEWGWSMYLNTSVAENKKKPSDSKIVNDKNVSYKIENIPFNTVDCFSPGITQDTIYSQLENNRKKYSGNYDGVLGSIKNFTYTLMPNGGYECTVTVISIGDVIDTIRLNDTLSTLESGSSASFNTEFNNVNADAKQASPEIKSQFELYMEDICKQADVDTTKTPKPTFLVNLKESIFNQVSPVLGKVENDFGDASGNTEVGVFSDGEIYRYDSEIFGASSEEVYFDEAQKSIKFKGYVPSFLKKEIVTSKLSDARSRYFISFGAFLAFLNSYKNLVGSKGENLIDIEFIGNPELAKLRYTMSNGLCIASYNSISIDPNVCLIKNTKAFIFKAEGGTEAGYSPKVTDSNKATTNFRREFLYEDTNLGVINNIYLNIESIISTYKEDSLSNNGYVFLGTFLRKILSKVSFALGSINDFDLFVLDNKVAVIDKHYTEPYSETSYSGKYKINVSGNNTIVRSHKIESKIFQSQATMIAIAAQDRENIASLQTSTYNYLNKDLTDRLVGDITTSKEDQTATDIQSRKAKLQSILILKEYVDKYVLTNKSFLQYHESNVIAMNGYLNTLLVELEGGSDYKALVPISLNLTFDGLSGLTIGEIFTINKQVLPKDYLTKSLGFIITRISNKLDTKEWLTTIETQFCLLDQQERQLSSIEKSEELKRQLFNQSEENKYDNISSIRYYNILAALTSDIVRRVFSITSLGEVTINPKESNLYIKSALLEYGAQTISLDNILSQLSISAKKIAPNMKAFVPRQRTPQELMSGLPGPVPFDPFQVDPYYINQSIVDGYYVLYNTLIISDLIKSTSYYSYMVSDVRSKFDFEFDLFLTRYKRILSTLQGTAAASVNYLNLEEFEFSFNILPLSSVSPNTGLLLTPLKVVEGYKPEIKKIRSSFVFQF